MFGGEDGDGGRGRESGYAPEGSEALAYSLGEHDLPTDLFEAFNVGCELAAAQLADPYYADHLAQYFAPNVDTAGSPRDLARY